MAGEMFLAGDFMKLESFKSHLLPIFSWIVDLIVSMTLLCEYCLRATDLILKRNNLIDIIIFDQN